MSSHVAKLRTLLQVDVVFIIDLDVAWRRLFIQGDTTDPIRTTLYLLLSGASFHEVNLVDISTCTSFA